MPAERKGSSASWTRIAPPSRSNSAGFSPLGRSSPSPGGRLATASVGRSRGGAAAAGCLAAEGLLDALRDRAQASLHCLGRGARALGGQFRDLAAKRSVLADQLGDHRIESRDKLPTFSALATRAIFRSRRTSPSPWCILLCFLGCHFVSCNKRKLGAAILTAPNKCDMRRLRRD